MILSTHFIAGAAAASFSDSPIVLIAVPLILHFVMDAVPHWEYVEDESELKHKIPQIAIDLFSGPILIILALLLLGNLNLKLLIWLFIGGFFGMLPDGLSLLYFIFPKNKLLKKFFSLHMAIHNDNLLSWKIGFPLQAALDVLAIALIVLPKL